MGSSRGGPKCLMGGIVLGMVLFAVLAYAMTVTDQRPFCSSCHVMQTAAITHKLGKHANLSCNECHAPHNILAKLPFKAKEGLRDFIANLQGHDVPYPANSVTRSVVNENCKACHAQTNLAVASMDAKPYCIDCHRSMAHMRQKPISTRMVAYE